MIHRELSHRPPTPSDPWSPRRLTVLAVAGLLAVIALAACGSSKSGTTSAPRPAAAKSSNPSGSRTGGGQNAPAAAGTVAAVSGATMQVQSQQNGQVAVSWTGSTTFSHTIATSISAVKAGQCVTAIAPSGTSSSATAFTATTMVVSSAVNGECTAGFGSGGQRPAGVPSAEPGRSGAASGGPSGGPGGGQPPSPGTGRAAIGSIASGKVLSVNGSSLVIATQSFGGTNSTPTSKTVTAGSATKITTEATTTSASVKVGKCVSAQGSADSGGTVTATSVRITDPTNGECASGFGGGPNGGR
jgi:hypothetical protein